MNDQTSNELDPDILDDTLSESLQTRWPARALPERQVQTILTNVETQNRKFTMQTRLSNILRPVAFIGGLALLILGLSWLLGSMRPNPAVETPATSTPLPINTPSESVLPAESTDPNATATPTAAVEPTGTPLPVSVPGSGFLTMPGVTFTFANLLPTVPGQVTLYQQHPQGELTEDSVRAMAAQMGVNGEITTTPGEGGDTIYNVTDGSIQMIFYGYPDQFSYFPITPGAPAPADPLPFDQRVAVAEEFLNAHSLLDYPYRAEPSETDPNGVRFVELLDGIPLLYGVGKNPGMIERLNISIDPNGQISSLFVSHHHYQPLDTYPLLTADQAWARLAAANADLRSRYAILAPPQSWTRAGTPPTEVIPGYLSNENGDTTFYADDGRSFPLLDIPADMPLYPVLSIKGTVTDAGLDWSEISLNDYGYGMTLSCGGGGGGGGGYGEPPIANFGGGNFATITLDSSAPTAPNAYISPVQPGEQVEGVQGVFYVLRHIYADGTDTIQYNFWYAGDENHAGWTATLHGDMLTGTEALQNLPIKIWGTVTALDANGLPVITVARYEEAYPGTRIQAWLVSQQVVTLEGQDVVVMTAQDGTQFVSSTSIQFGPEGSLIGNAGDTAIIEGYILPDQTFSGYPVLTELMGSVAGGTTLDNYEIQSNRIGVQDESTFPDPAASLTGHVTIENVELMYAAATLTRCTPEISNNPDYQYSLYAQPVWRFTGHFDDGRLFEVQIQALPDEYLR